MAGAKGGSALAKVQAALEPLRLEQVPCTSWLVLRESTDGSQLDLDCGTPDASAEALYRLAKSLHALRDARAGEALWGWLALPADSDAADNAGVFGALSRMRALLVVLGNAVLGPSELWTASGAAYLSLLGVEGAAQSWGTLFHPVIFQRVLCALRPLRAEGKQRKPLDGLQAAEEEGAAHQEANAQPPQTEDEQSVQMEPSRLETLELLRSLLSLLQACPIGTSEETALLTINELAALLLHPVDQVVAQSAAEGLSAIVSSAPATDVARQLATTVLRAVLPAILMTQDKGVSLSATVPRRLYHARAAALGLAQGLVRSQPELLKVSLRDAPACEPSERPEEQERTDAADNDNSDGDSGVAHDQVAGDKSAAPWAAKKAAARRAAKAQGADDPILAMLQIMCVSTPERVEWRVPSAEAVLLLLGDAAAVERAEAERAPRAGRIIQQLIQRNRGDDDGADAEVSADSAQQADQPLIVDRFLVFLDRLLESERATCRTFATEVAGMVLAQSMALVAADASEARASLDRRMLTLLVRRVSDAVPSVRSRALNGIAAALPALAEYPQGRESLSSLTRSSGRSTRPNRVNLASLFRSAALDEKALTRRAGLGLFEASLRAYRALGFSLEEIGARLDVELLGHLAMDNSMLVRKAAISSISLLLEMCPLPQVSKLWAHHVLPLVLDPEGSVVERALEEVYSAVLVPLSKLAPESRTRAAGGGGSKPASQRQAEDGSEADLALAVPARYQLPAALHGMDSEVTEYLQRAVRCFANRNQGATLAPITKALAAVVQESLALPISNWPLVVWSLLEELVVSPCNLRSGQMPPSLVHDAWERYESEPQAREGSPDGCCSHRTSQLGVLILGVLEFVGPYLPKARAQRLADGLCQRVASLRQPAEHVRAALRVIDRLDKAKLTGSTNVVSWRRTLLQSIEARLAQHVREAEQPGNGTAEDLQNCLFTLGELALADEEAISRSTARMLQTVVADVASDKGTTASMRGHALAALGKLCLRREELAKRSVELFVIHLDQQQPFAVRNNALIILGDLCEHYTSLVETFVPGISDLLRDPNELLRKQVTMILASLLSENFIKFRGSLVHRFLYALSDPAESIRHLVECVFIQILHRRNAAVFVQNFTEAICALNGWDGHPSYPGVPSNEGFSLASFPERRTTVYRFMLSLMTREQKFTVCSQLVTGFLASFVEGGEESAEARGKEGPQHLVELPRTAEEPGGQALGDALALLGCKEMRICFSPKLAVQVEDDLEGCGNAVGAAATVAAGTGSDVARGALSGMLRRVVCESIAPILVQLKDLMEAKRSPFLGRVRHCICEIMREFKEDLRDFLGADKRLAEEVAFDLGGSGEEALASSKAHRPDCKADVNKAESSCAQPLRIPKVDHRYRKRPTLGSTMTDAATAAGKNDDPPVVMSGLQKMLLRVPVRRKSMPGTLQADGATASAGASSAPPARMLDGSPEPKRRRVCTLQSLDREMKIAPAAATAAQAGASSSEPSRKRLRPLSVCEEELLPQCSPPRRPCSPGGRPVATPQAPPRRQVGPGFASCAQSPSLGLVGVAMSIQKGDGTPVTGRAAQQTIPIGFDSTPRRSSSSSGLGLAAAAAQCTPQGAARSTLQGTFRSTSESSFQALRQGTPQPGTPQPGALQGTPRSALQGTPQPSTPLGTPRSTLQGMLQGTRQQGVPQPGTPQAMLEGTPQPGMREGIQSETPPPSTPRSTRQGMRQGMSHEDTLEGMLEGTLGSSAQGTPRETGMPPESPLADWGEPASMREPLSMRSIGEPASMREPLSMRSTGSRASEPLSQREPLSIRRGLRSALDSLQSWSSRSRRKA